MDDMRINILTAVSIAALISGCGGGSSGSSDKNESGYSAVEAENNMYLLDGAVNDNVGLSNWSETIYDYYYDHLVQKRENNDTYNNKVLGCTSDGTMTINGYYSNSDLGYVYALSIDLNACILSGSELGGRLLLDLNVTDTFSDWNVSFDRFVIGQNMEGASETNGTMFEHATNATQTGYTLINATTSGADSANRYRDFKMTYLTSATKVDGAFDVVRNKKKCAEGNYTVLTFTPLTADSSGVTAGEIGINDISYTFNADKSIDVVDGLTMWKMTEDDYKTLKCESGI